MADAIGVSCLITGSRSLMVPGYDILRFVRTIDQYVVYHCSLIGRATESLMVTFGVEMSQETLFMDFALYTVQSIRPRQILERIVIV